MKRIDFIKMRSTSLQSPPYFIPKRVFRGKGSIRRLLLDIASLVAVLACLTVILALMWMVQP